MKQKLWLSMNAEQAKSTGKFVRMRRSTDWSWFYFWLVEIKEPWIFQPKAKSCNRMPNPTKNDIIFNLPKQCFFYFFILAYLHDLRNGTNIELIKIQITWISQRFVMLSESQPSFDASHIRLKRLKARVFYQWICCSCETYNRVNNREWISGSDPWGKSCYPLEYCEKVVDLKPWSCINLG